MQKRAPGGAAVPQLGHVRASAFPHDMQNFAEVGFSVPQLAQACDAMHSRYGMPGPFKRAFGTVARGGERGVPPSHCVVWWPIGHQKPQR